jgi:hypothetical protein
MKPKLTITIAAVAALICAGCNNGVVQEPLSSSDLLRYQQFILNGNIIYCATIKGHDYVIVAQNGIIHAAHCPCFTNKLERTEQ